MQPLLDRLPGEVAVRTAPWNETHPDADGDFLVWADDRNADWDIYAEERGTGQEIRVTDDPGTQRNPTVSGVCVAWEDDRDGDWDIYGRCLLEPSWDSDRSVSRRDGVEYGRQASWKGNRTVTRNGTREVGGDPKDAPPVVAHGGLSPASITVEPAGTPTAERVPSGAVMPGRRLARLPPS